jgi:YD repeat-containing protein
MIIKLPLSSSTACCPAFGSILATLLCLLALLPSGQAATPDVIYTYDAANRLIQAQYSSGAVIHYTYDAAGNRTQVTILGTIDPQADSDHDGLPDSWELRYFGHLGESAASDPDKDGLPNSIELAIGSSPILKNTDGDPASDYEEWVAGTDPADPNSYFQIIAPSSDAPARVSFQSSSNRLYTLAASPNLIPGSWTNVPGQVRVPGNGAPLSLTDTNAVPQRFYRVRVEMP